MDQTQIVEDKCKGCGICVNICASSILEMQNGKPAVVRPEFCLNCGHCCSVCPSDAILQPNKDSEKFRPESLPSAESLQHLFRSRRSIRHYKDKAISEEDLNKILEAGRYTATGSNSQNVRYIVFTDPEKIAELQKKVSPILFKLLILSNRVLSLPGAKFFIGQDYVNKVKTFYVPALKILENRMLQGEDRMFYNAPVLIIVYAEKFDETASFGCSATLYNCSLMAHLLGIGCCFNGFMQLIINHNSRIRKSLGIPRHMKCFGAMTLGYHDVKFKRLVKRDPPNITRM